MTLAISVLAVAALVGPAAGAATGTKVKPLVITKQDVGTTYSETAATASPDSFGKLATCTGLPATNRTVVSDVQGSEFSNQIDGSVIFSSVQVVKSNAMAKADRGVLSNAKFPDCVAQLLSQSAAAAAHLSGVRARRVTVKRFGDYSTAVLVEATGMTADGIPTSITQIEVGIAKGRAELSAGFTTHGSQPFDRRAAEQILAKVADRMNHAPVS